MNKKAQSLVLQSCSTFLEVTETSMSIKYKDIEGVLVFEKDFITVIVEKSGKSDSRKWRYKDIERLGDGIKEEIAHFLEDCYKKF